MFTMHELREQARLLRRKGKSFEDIARELQTPIARKTLEEWCSDIPARTRTEQDQIAARKEGERLEQLSLYLSTVEGGDQFEQAWQRSESLLPSVFSSGHTQVLLATLYLSTHYPKIRDNYFVYATPQDEPMKLFLSLLRATYDIDERLLRCQVYTRRWANQKPMLPHWSLVTGVPVSQFLETVDHSQFAARAMSGPAPMGVCMVSYESTDVLHDLLATSKRLLEWATGDDVDIGSFIERFLRTDQLRT